MAPVYVGKMPDLLNFRVSDNSIFSAKWLLETEYIFSGKCYRPVYGTTVETTKILCRFDSRLWQGKENSKPVKKEIFDVTPIKYLASKPVNRNVPKAKLTDPTNHFALS